MAEAPPAFFRPTGYGVELFVRLTPRASRELVEGLGETADGRRHLKARVRAVPEGGKANRALEELLAAWFGVPRRHVSVVSGTTTRLKTVAIAGNREELTGKLNALGTAGYN